MMNVMTRFFSGRKHSVSFLMSRHGQMTLPFVLLIGGIIVEITIAGAFVTYFLSSSGYGERLSIRASAAAESGIRDAMVKITQNKEWDPVPPTYILQVSSETNDSASLQITRTIPDTTHYKYEIISLGTAGSRQKKFVATVFVDTATGEVQLESIRENPIE
jgi:uncharacterized protein (UPF0333 family)